MKGRLPMRFDKFWGDDVPVGDAALPMLPAGTHTVTITAATFRELAFKKTLVNPAGLSLIITAEKSGFAPFELIIPANFRGLIRGICLAVGVAVPAKGDEWDEQCLVGKTSSAETTIYDSPNGKSYVNVAKWLGPIEPGVTKEFNIKDYRLRSLVELTPPPKPRSVVGPMDDIPFAWLVPFVLACLAAA